MQQQFIQRLRAGERQTGTLITLSEPAVAEILAASGFDWLFIDTEHGPFDAREIQGLLQAAGDCPCVVRVPSHDEVWIKKALDVGAAGIIAPRVNSVAEAEAIIRCCKYPPEGQRGVGIGRAHNYGYGFNDYLQHANEQIAVILQAEHIDAVECIDELVRVEGLDCVLVGPYDLSASMGLMGQVEHPQVVAAITRVRDCCQAAGIALGIFGVSAAAVAPYIEQGFDLIAVGVDVGFLGAAASEALKDLGCSE